MPQIITCFIRTQKRSEQGGGAGLSQLDGLSCCSVVPHQLTDRTVSVTLLRKAVERASCWALISYPYPKKTQQQQQQKQKTKKHIASVDVKHH